MAKQKERYQAQGEDFAADFGPFGDTVWLNCSHQGAIPRVAADQAREAVSWKVNPRHLITSEPFGEVPNRLKQGLGQLIGAPAEEIILGNSASYGIHLIANSYPWRPGDEVLLVKGDFPATILPWLLLEKRGVRVRFLEPRGPILQADEVVQNSNKNTRLLCTTWVHSFTGRAIDIQSIGQACQERHIAFVINSSQAIGARPFDIAGGWVDALSNVGHKWLCGPYGTGFCWVKPELRQSFEPQQAYWQTILSADDLARPDLEIALPTEPGPRTFDVFGTANFFNYKPWAASVAYLLEQGIDRIAAHDMGLVARFIQGLDPQQYDVLSPTAGPSQSTLIFISHKQPERNKDIYQTLQDKQIFCAFRSGRLRFSPHLYNTEADIDKAVGLLNTVG